MSYILACTFGLFRYIRKDGADGMTEMPDKLAVKTFAGQVSLQKCSVPVHDFIKYFEVCGHVASLKIYIVT